MTISTPHSRTTSAWTLPPSLAAVPYEGGWLLSGTQAHLETEAVWSPLLLPGMRRFFALAMHTAFMCSPMWGDAPAAVPAQTQFLLWEEDARCGVLVPLLDGDYRTVLNGVEGGLALHADAGPAGQPRATVTLAYLRYDADPYTLIHDAMTTALAWMGSGRPREAKAVPPFVEYLGWCTWDAFYERYAEAEVLQGLVAFRDAGIIPGWVLLDEGWQQYTADHFLTDYGAKDGFTDNRLRTLISRAKADFGVRMVGCWQTLFGELRGIDTRAPAFADLSGCDVIERHTERDRFGVVALDAVPRFHQTYHRRQAEDGVDFIKVDFQCAIPLMTYDEIGRVSAVRAWQQSLQASAVTHFGGQVLNCMSACSDGVYQYADSTVTRASDDFYPGNGNSHPRHVLMNACNSLWLGEVCLCDWDMFHSDHPWALYHAAARAISGGPVYVSDRPGHTDAALLWRLLAADGMTLRCPQPGRLTRDLLFTDPLASGRLITIGNTRDGIGLLGVFHPFADSPAIAALAYPALTEVAAEQYAVFSTRRGYLGVVDAESGVPVTLHPRDAEILVCSPLRDGFASLGLLEKLNPPACLLSSDITDGAISYGLRGGGVFGAVIMRPIADVWLDGNPVAFTHHDGLLRVETGDRARCRIEIRLA